MMRMKICFIGIGSIAKRHIGNLVTILGEENLQIDALRSHASHNLEVNIEHEYTDMKQLPDDYDIIFITNPTSKHMDTLLKVQKKSRAFFIEKPLRVMQNSKQRMNETIISQLDLNKIYYVACPLRYTQIVQYIKKNLDFDNVLSIRCISSSYLPEWRPGQDYRNTYSAKKELGGGVASDLIHEWDYISYLVGFPDHILKLEKKISNLEINTNDIALYIGECKDIVVEVHLDYFGRTPIRQMEILTKEDTIICDFLTSTIRYTQSENVVDLREQRNDFQQSELKHFLDIFNGNILNDSTIENADYLLRMLEV